MLRSTRLDTRKFPWTMASPDSVGDQELKDLRPPMQAKRLCALIAVVLWPASALGQAPAPIPGIQVRLEPRSYHVRVSRPVMVTLTIENTSDKPITLTVPGTQPEIPSPEMCLPLPHVFSGDATSGITVVTERGHEWEAAVGYRAPSTAPILLLGPHGSVGTTIDLREFYPALRSPGQYRITWRPYGGRAVSETVLVTIANLKQARIVMDDGTMTVRLFYEDAPRTVADFIELAKSDFYDGKTFHRLEPGYFLQGGCPRGDGTGVRADGKRIPAEFNGRPHDKGSVAMALLDDDPDSASCQFFICYTRQQDWDGRYTVFGELVGEESMATLDRLMAVPVDELSRPRRTLYMRNVRIVDAPSELPATLP